MPDLLKFDLCTTPYHNFIFEVLHAHTKNKESRSNNRTVCTLENGSVEVIRVAIDVDEKSLTITRHISSRCRPVARCLGPHRSRASWPGRTMVQKLPSPQRQFMPGAPLTNDLPWSPWNPTSRLSLDNFMHHTRHTHRRRPRHVTCQHAMNKIMK